LTDFDEVGIGVEAVVVFVFGVFELFDKDPLESPVRELVEPVTGVPDVWRGVVRCEGVVPIGALVGPNEGVTGLSGVRIDRSTGEPILS